MRLSFALPLILSLAGPAAAFDLSAMSEQEKAAFGAAVREYLIENPEVLVEAIAILERRQAEAEAAADQALVAQHRDMLMNDGFSFVGGNPDGDITLVEFMDYRCGYCRRAFAEVDALLAADGNIRFVVKEYPILGEQSLAAAQFAIAVKQLHGDLVYKSVHDALMMMEADVTRATLTEMATAFGLEPEAIFARMSSPEVEAEIEATRALAQAMNITGTPTFVFEDTMVRGYVPLAQMEAVVAEARDPG
jgi:protein-disulfide isomerase